MENCRLLCVSEYYKLYVSFMLVVLVKLILIYIFEGFLDLNYSVKLKIWSKG